MSLDSDLRELARIPLFTALEYEARRLLAFASETKILRDGEVLFRKGETTDGGYFLLAGTIEVDPIDERHPTRLVEPPTLIGELAILTDTERPATATARSPCTVLKIPRALFQRILKEHPRSAMQTRTMIESRLTAFARELNVARDRDFVDVSELSS
jgi:CRP-like cAMP-binding protein